MDDRLKETLSAMMDDEADELSVRRLLSHQHSRRTWWCIFWYASLRSAKQLARQWQPR